MKKIFILSAVLILVSLLVMISVVSAVCGDGILDAGETTTSCPLDVYCSDPSHQGEPGCPPVSTGTAVDPSEYIVCCNYGKNFEGGFIIESSKKWVGVTTEQLVITPATSNAKIIVDNNILKTNCESYGAVSWAIGYPYGKITSKYCPVVYKDDLFFDRNSDVDEDGQPDLQNYVDPDTGRNVGARKFKKYSGKELYATTCDYIKKSVGCEDDKYKPTTPGPGHSSAYSGITDPNTGNFASGVTPFGIYEWVIV